MKKRITLNSSLEKNTTESIFVVNIFIAISYAVFGFISDLLTIQASDATVIWPSAGVALAGCLIWGRGVWPGIFFGAFIINVWIGFDLSSVKTLQNSIILASTISLGAVLQALIGHFLVIKLSAHSQLFQTSKEVCRLLCLGGAVSCTISPSIGVSSLVFAEIIPVEQYFTNWLVWWLGDAIGVIIFTPITLSFFARPRTVWESKKYSVALPLFVVMVIIISVFAYASIQEHKQQTLVIKNYTSNLFNNFNTKIDNHQESLHTLASFFEQSENVTRTKFQEFTKRILKQQSDIQAFAWIQYIEHSEKQLFEQQIIKEGFVGFKIFDKQTPLISASQHKKYAVIRYIEPFEKNKAALGLNILSDKNVAETLLKSIKTKDIAITSGIELVQDNSKGLAFIIYCPVYKKNYLLSGKGNQSEALSGFVASVIYVSDLVDATLTKLDKQKTIFQLYDQTISNHPQLLYSTHSEVSLNKKTSYQQELLIADRRWVIYSSAEHIYPVQGRLTWLVLLGGLTFATMFSGFLLILSGRSSFIKQTVKKKTKDLEQLNYVLQRTNQALATTNNKLQNSEYQFRKLVQTQSAIVWRYDLLLGKFTFVSDEAESLLGYSNEQWFKKGFWINHVHPDDRQQALAYTLSAARSYQKYDF